MVIWKILSVILLVTVVICLWKSVEYQNTLPKGSKGAMILAWDALVMFLVVIALMIRIVQM